MFPFENTLTRLQFRLRRDVFGRIKVRPGLPAPVAGAGVERERGFYSLVCEKAFDLETRARVALVWDIGCRNWSYARALAAAFPRANLIGVEVDGGRRYWNLHRRMDMAAAHAVDLVRHGRGARCVFRDFRELHLESLAADPGLGAGDSGRLRSIQAFGFFFPFVSPRPCVRWGLPPDYADFRSLLEHAGNSAGPKIFLSTHQGEWEAEIASKAYLEMGLEPRESVLQPTEFSGLWPSPHPVHVLSAASAAR